MSDIYIDPSAVVNGNGAIDTPYNSFTETNALLTGDQAGRWVYIKGGTTIRQRLSSVADASNYSIGAYGGGNKPVIKASTLPVWTYDSTNGVWWTADTQPDAYKSSVFLDGFPLLYVASIGAMTLNTAHFDYAANKRYIKVTDNPNASGVELSTILNAITVYRPKVIRDIEARHGNDTTVQIQGLLDDCLLESMDVFWGGSDIGTLGRNCYEVKGQTVPGHVLATNVRVRNCTAYGAQNNAFEIWNLDGAVFEKNTSHGQLSNMYELWLNIQNSVFEGNKQYTSAAHPQLNSGHFARLFGYGAVSTTIGQNNNNIFRNNLAVGCISSPIVVEGKCTGNKFYHNTLIECGKNANDSSEASGLEIAYSEAGQLTPPTGTEFKNNIVYTTKSARFMSGNTTLNCCEFDGNILYTPSVAFPRWRPNTTDGTITALATWNAKTYVGTDQWVDAALNADYTLPITSPAIGTAIAGLASGDINGLRRTGTIDVGAEQYRDIPITTTSTPVPLL